MAVDTSLDTGEGAMTGEIMEVGERRFLRAVTKDKGMRGVTVPGK